MFGTEQLRRKELRISSKVRWQWLDMLVKSEIVMRSNPEAGDVRDLRVKECSTELKELIRKWEQGLKWSGDGRGGECASSCEGT